MTEDIFKFWGRLGDKFVHPDDIPILDRMSHDQHGFDLDCVPGNFFGKLRSAPVILLFGSPGLSSEDRVVTSEVRARQRENFEGNLSVFSEHDHRAGWNWWTGVVGCFGDPASLRDSVAVFNIGAYHSKAVNYGAL